MKVHSCSTRVMYCFFTVLIALFFVFPLGADTPSSAHMLDELISLQERYEAEIITSQERHLSAITSIQAQVPELWETDAEFAQRIQQELEDERVRYERELIDPSSLQLQLLERLFDTFTTVAQQIISQGEQFPIEFIPTAISLYYEVQTYIANSITHYTNAYRASLQDIDSQAPELWETDAEFNQRISEEKQALTRNYYDIIGLSEGSTVGQKTSTEPFLHRFFTIENLLLTIFHTGWTDYAPSVLFGQYERNTRVWPVDLSSTILSTAVSLPFVIDFSAEADLRTTLIEFDRGVKEGVLTGSIQWSIVPINGVLVVSIDAVSVSNPLTGQVFSKEIEEYYVGLPYATSHTVFAQDIQVLIYIDTDSVEGRAIGRALNQLEWEYTEASSWNDFNQKLDSSLFAVAIAFNQGRTNGIDREKVKTYIQEGGRILVNDWDKTSDIAAIFQAEFTDERNPTQCTILDEQLKSSLGYQEFRLENQSWGVFSTPMRVKEQAVSLINFGSNSAMVLGNNGQSLLMGFIDDTFPASLDPASFYQALLLRLTGQQGQRATRISITLWEAQFTAEGLPAGFTTEGSSGSVWKPEVIDGTIALVSGSIDHHGSVSLQKAVSLDQKATLNFTFGVSSEEDYDFLEFYVKREGQDSRGTLVKSWSGNISKQTFSHSLEPGNYVLHWRYMKDESYSEGRDRATLYNITLESEIVVGSTSPVTSIQLPPAPAPAVPTPAPAPQPVPPMSMTVWQPRFSVDSLPDQFHSTTVNGSQWYPTNIDGRTVLQSGAITHDQAIVLSTVVFVKQQATLYFTFGVSSESGYDELEFHVKQGGYTTPTTLVNSWSGEIASRNYSYEMSPGAYLLEWKYVKDGSDSRGKDCAFIYDMKIDYK